MKTFFGILLGIILLIAGGFCFPFSQKCMDASCEHMDKFWRWRGLGLMLILLSFVLFGLAFFVIAKSLD